VLVVKLTTRRLLDWHRSIAERPRRWRSRPSLLGGIDAWVKAGQPLARALPSVSTAAS
jgi:hypothetical protein